MGIRKDWWSARISCWFRQWCFKRLRFITETPRRAGSLTDKHTSLSLMDGFWSHCNVSTSLGNYPILLKEVVTSKSITIRQDIFQGDYFGILLPVSFLLNMGCGSMSRLVTILESFTVIWIKRMLLGSLYVLIFSFIAVVYCWMVNGCQSAL